MAQANTSTSIETNSPAFIAWAVITKDGKSYWQKLGASWEHKDKSGFTLQLDSLPVGGRIVLRKPLPKQEPK